MRVSPLILSLFILSGCAVTGGPKLAPPIVSPPIVEAGPYLSDGYRVKTTLPIEWFGVSCLISVDVRLADETHGSVEECIAIPDLLTAPMCLEQSWPAEPAPLFPEPLPVPGGEELPAPIGVE